MAAMCAKHGKEPMFINTKRAGDAVRSERRKSTCEITADFRQARQYRYHGTNLSANYGGLGDSSNNDCTCSNLDHKHVTADRIVIASRPVAAESVARLRRSATESADTWVTAARSDASAQSTHNPTAAQAAQQRAELGDRAAQFSEP